MKTITNKQIAQLCDVFRKVLQSNRRKLPSNIINDMLTQSVLDGALIKLILHFMEDAIDVFKRRIKSSVVLPRDKKEAFEFVGLTRNCFNEAESFLPPVPSKVDHEVTFIGLNLSNQLDLSRNINWVAYVIDKCGFKFVDPYILGLINQKDESLRKQKPNCTVWGSGGKSNYRFTLLFSQRSAAGNEDKSPTIPSYTYDIRASRIWFAVVPK